MRKIVLIALIFFACTANAQQHAYIFKVEDIVEPGPAKEAIDVMRAISNIKTAYFDDESDRFRVVLKIELDFPQFILDMQQVGYIVDPNYEYVYSE